VPGIRTVGAVPKSGEIQARSDDSGAANGAPLAQRTVAASAGGYKAGASIAQQQAEGARVWAVEGAGHYGAGSRRHATRLLKRYLARHLYRLLQNQEPLMA
jgi:hypothetical protein